ncbi:MAG: PqqD family protein [Ruminococcus sp.]|nr:PqqD family protein [Ruminococcus sp.]
MKVKSDFVLRKISDSYVVVPVGDSVVDFSGLINLNESGAILFKLLQKGAEESELVDALLNEYNVDREVAEADVKKFVAKVKDADILE